MGKLQLKYTPHNCGTNFDTEKVLSKFLFSTKYYFFINSKVFCPHLDLLSSFSMSLFASSCLSAFPVGWFGSSSPRYEETRQTQSFQNMPLYCLCAGFLCSKHYKLYKNQKSNLCQPHGLT